MTRWKIDETIIYEELPRRERQTFGLEVLYAILHVLWATVSSENRTELFCFCENFPKTEYFEALGRNFNALEATLV
jgi:hypothetical protein